MAFADNAYEVHFAEISRLPVTSVIFNGRHSCVACKHHNLENGDYLVRVISLLVWLTQKKTNLFWSYSILSVSLYFEIKMH